MAFLVCVSSHDVSECLVAHHADRGIFSCVYLHMTFLVGPIYKGLVAHPTSKWFFSCAHFSWHFWSVRLTKVSSHILPAFLLCVPSRDIPEYLVTHPAGIGLFSCVYLFLTFLVSLIEKCLVTHTTYIWFFSCAHFLMTFLVGLIDKDLVAHPAGFSPVCLITWHFRIFHRTSCRQRAFLLLCVSSFDISECLVAHPVGKGLFSFLYLCLIFQNVKLQILQA